VHDSVIAIYAATLGRPGIVVNAGTGSFAAGIGADGRTIRAGGWGNIIDDEGSAYDIGKLAIRAALRALDGAERKTAIAKARFAHRPMSRQPHIIVDPDVVGIGLGDEPLLDLEPDGERVEEGDKPINTSGGLKCKGHPVGASGIAQIYEQFEQLRGTAGGRQIPDVELALTHNVGGSGSTAVVHILSTKAP
jgi:hypothetical protein